MNKFLRYSFVALLAMIVGNVMATDVTDELTRATFGVTGIKWVHNLSSLAKYPAILVAVTVFIAWVTALYTGTVKARDTASIE